MSYNSLSVVEVDPVNAVRPAHVPGFKGHTYTSPVLYTDEPGAVPFGAPTTTLGRLRRGHFCIYVTMNNGYHGKLVRIANRA